MIRLLLPSQRQHRQLDHLTADILPMVAMLGVAMFKLLLVLALHVLHSEHGSGLLVNNSAEAGLALDDNVGHTHLAAECGEEHNKLNGVNIVGNDNK